MSLMITMFFVAFCSKAVVITKGTSDREANFFAFSTDDKTVSLEVSAPKLELFIIPENFKPLEISIDFRDCTDKSGSRFSGR